ncbi:MAG: 50S ribosomal protein L35 [Patescibacteria group bacterium]|nr:50S ribosomal protein L35 [Patescibacteria group bacterium]
MPKIKTHSGAKKRFKTTSTGKIKRQGAFANHLLEHKSKDQKRNYKGDMDVAGSDKKNVKKMLGVG